MMHAFILLALQVVAASHTNPPNYGWTALGEFSSIQACVKASKQLVLEGEGVANVKKFVCVAKDK